MNDVTEVDPSEINYFCFLMFYISYNHQNFFSIKENRK